MPYNRYGEYDAPEDPAMVLIRNFLGGMMALGIGYAAAVTMLSHVAYGVGRGARGARRGVASGLQRLGRAVQPSQRSPQPQEQRGWLRRSAQRVRGAARQVRQRSARGLRSLAGRIRPAAQQQYARPDNPLGRFFGSDSDSSSS